MLPGAFKFVLKAIILIHVVNIAGAYTDPKNPKMPSLQNQKQEQQQKQEDPGLIVNARIVFFNRKTVFTGLMQFKPFKLSIQNTKDGFRFFKDLPAEGIKKIKIKSWKGSKYKNEKYVFYPVEYEITDTAGVSFTHKATIKELQQFAFETSYGKTKLYSYYYDNLKDDYWELTGRSGKSILTNMALAKVVAEIEFNPAQETIEEKQSEKPKGIKKKKAEE